MVGGGLHFERKTTYPQKANVLLFTLIEIFKGDLKC